MVACEQSNVNHPILKYYPSNDVFEDGYVNKYYRHYYPNSTDLRAATEVTYSKFRKDGNRIFVERYNAGFDLSGITELKITDTEVLAERLVDIRRLDTIDIEIINPVRSTWVGSQSDPYILRYEFNDKFYRYVENQINLYDTLIDGREAKVLVSDVAYHEEETNEEINQYRDTSIYVSDLGFYEGWSGYDGYNTELELIEQMSEGEFERRANHDKHRIAWIDESKALDDTRNFKICGHERFIADYYNSTPDGRYIHGKRALLDTVKNNFDESKMMEQNGMIVFRFVVNCEGKPGRFVVNGYDFGYQPLKFESVSIDHLFSILQKLDEWRPVVIDDEARDAYFYITFKIEDGKITDILP